MKIFLATALSATEIQIEKSGMELWVLEIRWRRVYEESGKADPPWARVSQVGLGQKVNF